MPIATPREKRQQKTRQSILAAAMTIVANQGAEALSMRSLAEAIDYSASGIYEYFDSKEAILQTLNREGHQQLTTALASVDSSLAPGDYLTAIGLAYIDFALRNPDLYQVMFSKGFQVTQFAEMCVEGSSFPILLRAIQRGLDEEVFKPRAGFGLYEMAYGAWANVHGISMMRIYQRNFPENFDAFRAELVRAYVQGLMRG
jgi:AcrR family transcriptional regulator